jgi:hypothetical protein
VYNSPKVVSVDGQYKHDGQSGCLIWYNAIIDDSNSSGSLEFTVDGGSSEFFPINIQYTARPICPIVVQGCRGAGDGAEVKYEITERSSPENYTCE